MYCADPYETYKNTGCVLLSTHTGLRSASDTTRLTVPRTVQTLKYAATRSFIHVAPCLWNSLPATIRESKSVTIFKKHLKNVSKVPLVAINFVSISCFSCYYIIVSIYVLFMFNALQS